MLTLILTYTHHITTMLFGIFLSAFFLGVKQNRHNVLVLSIDAIASGLLYVLVSVFFGSGPADQLYPLLVHLPLFFVLTLYYNFRYLPSLISIMTAYLCCQCSNWIGLFVLSIANSPLSYYTARIIVTAIVFILLCKYVCQTTAMLFEKSDRELLIIGSLPLVYYIFDYATTKFTSLLYTGNKAIPEFLGFAICLSYLAFLLVYFKEYELKNRATQYNELINMQLHSLDSEIGQVRKSEHDLAILRHDMRHHLSVLKTLIQEQELEKACNYINEINTTYDDTVIKSYCRNDLLNSVLSIYSTRFEENNIDFDFQITVSRALPCSEMTFCAILSNVLENAMHAVMMLPEENRRIELSISEKSDHLLLLEKNTTKRSPVFADNIPVTSQPGHGLGVQSIIYYVESLHGQYQFYMEDKQFVVRIIL